MLIAVFITEMVILHKYVYLFIYLFIIFKHVFKKACDNFRREQCYVIKTAHDFWHADCRHVGNSLNFKGSLHKPKVIVELSSSAMIDRKVKFLCD